MMYLAMSSIVTSLPDLETRSSGRLEKDAQAQSSRRKWLVAFYSHVAEYLAGEKKIS
jgi:hypothetical protein